MRRISACSLGPLAITSSSTQWGMSSPVSAFITRVGLVSLRVASPPSRWKLRLLVSIPSGKRARIGMWCDAPSLASASRKLKERPSIVVGVASGVSSIRTPLGIAGSSTAK